MRRIIFILGTIAGLFGDRVSCTVSVSDPGCAPIDYTKVTSTTTADVYTVKDVASGMCVDVTGASTAEGAQIVHRSAIGGNNQKWRFTAA